MSERILWSSEGGRFAESALFLPPLGVCPFRSPLPPPLSRSLSPKLYPSLFLSKLPAGAQTPPLRSFLLKFSGKEYSRLHLQKMAALQTSRSISAGEPSRAVRRRGRGIAARLKRGRPDGRIRHAGRAAGPGCRVGLQSCRRYCSPMPSA